MPLPVLGLDGFICRARATHGSKYKYDLSVYQQMHAKVIITCDIHGNFEQTPNAHIRGMGCPTCGRENINKALEEKSKSAGELFSKKATDVHNGRYDYSKVQYTRSSKEVVIVCPVHGEFQQTPNAHLAGKGCRTCNLGGFVSDKPASLYIMNCDGVWKVGITNRNPKTRLADLRNGSKLPFELVKVWNYADGYVASKVEDCILADLRASFDGVDDVFNGSTECFKIPTDVDFLARVSLHVQ